MMGLRWRKPELRQSFFQLYHQKLPTDLYARMEHLLGRQSWQSLGQQFWIELVLQFLLAIATGPLSLPAQQLRVRSAAALETGSSGGAAMPPAPSASQTSMVLDSEDMLGPSQPSAAGPPASAKTDADTMAVDAAASGSRSDR